MPAGIIAIEQRPLAATIKLQEKLQYLPKQQINILLSLRHREQQKRRQQRKKEREKIFAKV